ncbi:uncharacterized protein B0T23DRAFT_420763 [Neurospora hispaniola]|uniref:Uncharacterized protein n=1 Tax=Neurospora hispaniola TaxID=588809 RepID=A0AAJ0I527_9PEZI|nr:hypothetical protein B0T23DRAFT_420763 [Neurospora hispaniola]
MPIARKSGARLSAAVDTANRRSVYGRGSYGSAPAPVIYDASTVSPSVRPSVRPSGSAITYHGSFLLKPSLNRTELAYAMINFTGGDQIVLLKTVNLTVYAVNLNEINSDQTFVSNPVIRSRPRSAYVQALNLEIYKCTTNIPHQHHQIHRSTLSPQILKPDLGLINVVARPSIQPDPVPTDPDGSRSVGSKFRIYFEPLQITASSSHRISPTYRERGGYLGRDIGLLADCGWIDGWLVLVVLYLFYGWSTPERTSTDTSLQTERTKMRSSRIDS